MSTRASIAQPHGLLADHQVIAKVRAGDVDAFEVLVDRYHGPLTQHLTYRVGDPELGADLAQDTFVEAFRSLKSFGGHRSFAAWLYGIAHNRLLMHWRHQRVRRLISLDWLTEFAATPAPLCQPDMSMTCQEQDVLSMVFGQLTPSLREALLLHSLDGFTASEIAGILGISRSAAERRVSRAKEQFRQRYDELHTDQTGHTHGH